MAKCISTRYGHDVVELDALFWLPDWTECGTDDFNRKVSEAMERTSGMWVVDGNYFGKLSSLVSEQCDTVIWLDLPWRLVFWRIVMRSIFRSINKERICGDNLESWRSMVNRQHIIWDYLRKRKSYRLKGERLLSKVSKTVPVIRVGSRKELDFLYDTHGLKRE